VNHELFGLLIIRSSGLHLDRVVTVAELSEAEAAHVREVIDLVHKGTVAVCVQGDQSPTEQVELDGELSG